MYVTFLVSVRSILPDSVVIFAEIGYSFRLNTLSNVHSALQLPFAFAVV